MNTINVDVILNELRVAKSRLEAQEQLAANSRDVYATATSTGSHALARIASVRLKRHEDVISETRKVIAELEALLPPPQPQLELKTEVSKPPKGASHSSRT